METALALHDAIANEAEGIAELAISVRDGGDLQKAARLLRKWQGLQAIKDQVHEYGRREFFGW